MSACGSSSSPSLSLLLFVLVPLALVSGYVSLVGPHRPAGSWSWRFSWKGTPSASSFSLSPVSETKEGIVAMNAMAPTPMGAGLSEEEASAQPPILGLAVTPLPSHVQVWTNTTDGGNLKIADNNFTTDAPSLNKSGELATPEAKRKEYTSLDWLEADLRRARSAIKQARNGTEIPDQDYVPVGPMYLNAHAFHRSYVEMEKRFKIFVYDDGEPPIFHNGPCKSIYSMEGNFIHTIEINRQFRTMDPDKAHAFFLPFSVAMLVRFVYVRDSRDLHPIRQTVADYIDVLSRKYPYWNRSLGYDHFMLACHDWGPLASFSVPNLYKNSIRVLCNANTSEGFNPSKDVSLLEINLVTGGTQGLLGGPSPSRRPILAFFAGGLHGPIRATLLEHWENKDEDIKVHKYLPKGISYYAMLRKSKYCLCPSGYEVASPRISEAIYTGCIPVLISDHYVPPFADVLNWKSFSVEVPVREIPNLKRILGSISSRQYIRMQRRVGSIRRHFEINFPPKRYDVFHMILHSVWLRRLNVRVGEL